MKKIVILGAIFSIAATLICALIYNSLGSPILLTLAITFGTTAYHFVMRLLVGYGFHTVMKNEANYQHKWYQTRPWEAALYKKMKVKKWKAHMPTFDPTLFDRRLHSWEDIVKSTCQAELVHETIALLSFLPILFSIWFGAALVFIITSTAAASADLMFVIMQRYNRPRIVKLINRKPHRCSEGAQVTPT